MKLLVLDTSTEWCSAALWLDGTIRARRELAGQRHSSLILPMIDGLLAGNGLRLAELDGIGYGAGPGSFTGLRIACAVTQGLAFGAGLPVAGVSTLEALAAQAEGDRVLTLLDVSDVYMTFFLPETVAGRVALGSDVRIVLDAAPQYTIPAKVSFVASTAQFTPKTVETASERQKLMFRIKAQIDPLLLQKHLRQVKTGLPGVAWVKLDAETPWPENLQTRLPE